MIESYGVERFDQVTAKQMQEIGFSTEFVEYLTAQGVTKDEVVLAYEKFGDENVKLDALMATIGEMRAAKEVTLESVVEEVSAEPVVAEEASSLPPSEPAAE